jgi:hypothetical protein
MWLAFALAGALVFASCGGGGSTGGTVNPPSGQGSTAPVSITVRDTPPAGVTILSFEVTVQRAALQPGNVNLVTSPIKIEVKRLEVEAALLNTLNVPAGTYTSIDVTFSNPELTFKNDTGATLANCAAGAVCEIKPAVTTTVSYNGPPFPLTIQVNTPIGLLVDVNLSNIITSALAVDFNATGAVTVSNLPPVQGTGQIEEIEDLKGTVTAKDTPNNQFTLQLGATGQSLTIRVDTNTQFEDFDEVGCLTANFACVATGQIVEVDARLIAGGALLAKKVEADDNDVDEEFEGIITKINSATQFEMVLVEKLVNGASLDLGQLVVINLLPSTQFRIDDDGLPLQGGQFNSSADLMVGQTVEIDRKSTPTGTPPAVDTDRIKLKFTRFTATVQSVNAAGNQFVVNNLPGLFTAQGITQLTIFTSPTRTNFNNLTNLAALAAGNTVSLRALIFQGGGTPFGVAKKVRKR